MIEKFWGARVLNWRLWGIWINGKWFIGVSRNMQNAPLTKDEKAAFDEFSAALRSDSK